MEVDAIFKRNRGINLRSIFDQDGKMKDRLKELKSKSDEIEKNSRKQKEELEDKIKNREASDLALEELNFRRNSN